MTSRSLLTFAVLALACNSSSSPSSTSDSTSTTDASPGDTQASDSTASAPVCGNGIVESDEDCDDGANSANCDLDCTVPACGDGVINALVGETCEPELQSDCRPVGDPAECTRCGDNIVDPSAGEQCDGNPDSGQSVLPCSETCEKTGLLVFVSSTPVGANFEGGITGADSVCTQLADAAITANTLKGTGFAAEGTRWPFKAWLSGGTDDS